MSMDAFNKAMAKFTEHSVADTEKVIRAQVISLFDDVITRSPVGNADDWKNPKAAPAGYVGGRFRSNWFANIDSPSRKITDAIKDENATKEAAEDTVDAARGDVTFFLTNNLPYAQRLEEGYSKQAIDGIVAPALVGATKALERAAAAEGRRRRR